MTRRKATLLAEIAAVIAMVLAVEWLAAVFTHSTRNYLPVVVAISGYLLVRAILIWKAPGRSSLPDRVKPGIPARRL
jgi:hypothetical protein